MGLIVPWEDYGFNHTSLHRMVRGMIMGENDTLARGIMRYCSTPSQGIMGFIHPEGVLMLPKGRRPEGSIKTPKGWMKPIILHEGWNNNILNKQGLVFMPLEFVANHISRNFLLAGRIMGFIIPREDYVF